MANFTFSVVNAGQRNVDVKASLIATSTKGGFRLTGPAAEALGIAPGQNAMFVKGVDENGAVAWFIGKGFAKKHNNGTEQTCKPYGAKEAVKANFDACLAKAMESGNDKLVAALVEAEGDAEKQVDILAEAMQVTKYEGSKTASPSKQTGLGATLTFTDNNIWASLKSDVEDPESVNREFELDVESIIEAELPNGFDTTVVKLIQLGDYADAAPMVRNSAE